MFRILLTTTLLVGALGATTPALAGDDAGHRWHKPSRHERPDGHEWRRLQRVERHAYRDTRRQLRRAERHGERRAWRQWRRDHHRYPAACRYRRHAHLHPLPIRPGYGHRGWRHHEPADHHPDWRVRHDTPDPVPVPIIGGGVIGGVLGNELGDGDPAAATVGLFIGSMVGYGLSRH